MVTNKLHLLNYVTTHCHRLQFSSLIPVLSVNFPLDDYAGRSVDLEVVFVSVIICFAFVLVDSVVSVKLALHKADVGGIEAGMVRLSVGLENSDDIIDDLEKAFAAV